MKIDLHVHSSDLSLCGHIPSYELVDRYIEAGSDCHQIEDIGLAGIEIESTISTMEELCQLLREDRYKVYVR